MESTNRKVKSNFEKRKTKNNKQKEKIKKFGKNTHKYVRIKKLK